MKSETLTVRLDVGTKGRIDAAFSKLPYRPSLTAIIERGINLAIKEAEAILSIAKPRHAALSDRQYLEKIANQVIARNQPKAETSREASPASGTESGQRGAGVVSACPTLIDDVGSV